jgi:hypothetical protein
MLVLSDRNDNDNVADWFTVLIVARNNFIPPKRLPSAGYSFKCKQHEAASRDS